MLQICLILIGIVSWSLHLVLIVQMFMLLSLSFDHGEELVIQQKVQISSDSSESHVHFAFQIKFKQMSFDTRIHSTIPLASKNYNVLLYC